MHDYSEEGNTVTMNAGLPFSLMRSFRAIEAHLKQMGIPDHPTCLMELLQAKRDSGRDEYSDSVTQQISCADDFLSELRLTWRH